MSFFSVEHLTAGYGKETVISDISFSLESGILMGILGSNGCGKTTLLKSLCGILPHTGSCTLQDINLGDLSPKQLSRLCSYIPQRSGISIDISVLDVVLMGFNPYLKLLEYPTLHMKELAKQALTQVGLIEKANMNYMHLSEGQKQLCILARTLAADSHLLLLDEPESALDFHYRYQILDTLRNWVHEKGRGAVVTLHDPNLALNYCDSLLLMSKGQILDILHPKTDPLEKMESMLSHLYGNISLHICQNRKGVPQLVMLKEEEE